MRNHVRSRLLEDLRNTLLRFALTLLALCCNSVLGNTQRQTETLATPSEFSYEKRLWTTNDIDSERAFGSYTAGEVKFNSEETFSIKLIGVVKDTQPIQADLPLSAFEELIILADGNLLSVRRESKPFGGTPPSTTESLRNMCNLHLTSRYIPTLYESANLDDKKIFLSGFGFFADFGVPLTINMQAIELNRCDSSELIDGVLHVQHTNGAKHTTFAFTRINAGWVIKRRIVSIRDPDAESGYQFYDSESDFYFADDGEQAEKSSHSRRRVKGRFASGQQVNLLEETEISKIQYGTNTNIQLDIAIENKTPVILYKSQHIRACWMDGKVVRVYDGGTVDDLGTAVFVQKSKKWSSWYVVTAFSVLAIVMCMLVFYQRKTFQKRSRG